MQRTDLVPLVQKTSTQMRAKESCAASNCCCTGRGTRNNSKRAARMNENCSSQHLSRGRGCKWALQYGDTKKKLVYKHPAHGRSTWEGLMASAWVGIQLLISAISGNGTQNKWRKTRRTNMFAASLTENSEKRFRLGLTELLRKIALWIRSLCHCIFADCVR